MKGGLIVMEGADGTGKSSLSVSLSERLKRTHDKVVLQSFPGRIPGTIGRMVYDIHHNAEDFGIAEINPSALQCLHIAAHLDTISSQILPAVNSGHLVILDRYWWSASVYGVVGGGNRGVIEKLIEAEVLAWDWLKPSALFLIDRESPLKDDPLDVWKLHRMEYIALAKKESDKYPVHVIDNNVKESDALDRMSKILDGLI